MTNLKPAIFVVPIIALLLCIIFYIFLLKKTSDKDSFKRFTLIVLVLAIILNLTWELLQGPLYKGHSYNIKSIAICTLASVADAVMVILIYFSFALIWKNPLWVQHFNRKRVILVMLVGFLGAIAAEVAHTSASSWAYNESMPLIPFVNVGLSPILQFAILPILIYKISFFFVRRTS